MRDDETRCLIKAGMWDFFQVFGWFHSSLHSSVFSFLHLLPLNLTDGPLLIGPSLEERKKKRCIQNTFRLGTIPSQDELSGAGLGFNWLRVQLGLSAASGRSYASSQNSHFTPQLLGRRFYNRQILFTALSRGGTDKMSKMRGRRDGELSSAGRFIFHVETQRSRRGRELEKRRS